MRKNLHPATERDHALVADVLASVRGASDSGAAVFNLLDLAEARFETLPWQVGDASGEWVCAPGTDSSGVVLYLHGRRFQHEEPPSVYAAALSAATSLPVLHARYRLAPAHPYPAALDDVLAAYAGLLELGYPADRIAVVGHSAGATLALSALLRLRETALPMPACAVVLSPITDFTLSGATLTENAEHDVLGIDEFHQVSDAYLGSADPTGAPQSPLFGDCAGLPPLLIGCGEAEMLRADATRFAERADAAGTDVTMHVYEAMPHGFPVLPFDASADLLQRLGTYIRDQFADVTLGAPIGPLTIRRVGWAAYEITTEHGTRVLVDPYLGGDEGFHTGLPQSPVKPADLASVDVIAVTHAGYDHRGQALEIAASGQATLLSGTALYQAALDFGIPPERLAPTVSGVEFRHRDVSIKALPARHESTMRIDGRFVADQPQSFLVSTAAGSRIFCGGDLSLSEDVRTWGELYRPQVAVLGIGGIRVGATRVVELPPHEAAVAARQLGVSTVIPVHYLPGDPAPAQLAADLGEHAHVAVLGFDETWTAAPSAPPAADH